MTTETVFNTTRKGDKVTQFEVAYCYDGQRKTEYYQFKFESFGTITVLELAPADGREFIAQLLRVTPPKRVDIDATRKPARRRQQFASSSERERQRGNGGDAA